MTSQTMEPLKPAPQSVYEMPPDSDKILTLISNEGDRFEIKYRAARLSKVISQKIESNTGLFMEGADEMNLSSINTKYLEICVKYLNYKDKYLVFDGDIPDCEEEIGMKNASQEDWIELLLISNYLEC